MGIFGFVKGRMNDLQEEKDTANMEAMDRKDPAWTLRELSNLKNDVHGMAKQSGYITALRSLLRDKSINELKEYYEESYNTRNVKALNALRPFIEEQGYTCRDENGNWLPPRDTLFPLY